MEGIFTLPYSEYAVANKLNELLGKNNCSIYIPTSRQQKGIDLIVNKNETKNIVRIQVKSSRTYIDGGKNPDFQYHLWLGNFINRYQKNLADFYIIVGIYAELNMEMKVSSKTKIWKELYLCYTDNEMYKLLKNVKTINKSKSDLFFGYSFTSPNKIYLSRGFKYLSLNEREASADLLDNKIEYIKTILND